MPATIPTHRHTPLTEVILNLSLMRTASDENVCVRPRGERWQVRGDVRVSPQRHTETCCNTLYHTASHKCDVRVWPQQNTATQCTTLHHTSAMCGYHPIPLHTVCAKWDHDDVLATWKASRLFLFSSPGVGQTPCASGARQCSPVSSYWALGYIYIHTYIYIYIYIYSYIYIYTYIYIYRYMQTYIMVNIYKPIYKHLYIYV